MARDSFLGSYLTILHNIASAGMATMMREQGHDAYGMPFVAPTHPKEGRVTCRACGAVMAYVLPDVHDEWVGSEIVVDTASCVECPGHVRFTT